MKTFKRASVGAFLAAAALIVAAAPAGAQEAAQPSGQASSYRAAGRRDPFKNLLGGKELIEKRTISGLADLMVDEVNILGLVRVKGRYDAIIALTEGFPLTAHEGDRLADGYILTIREGEVVLRKTKERGVPLLKPKDIVKQIISEER